jgi:hypothetical protein
LEEEENFQKLMRIRSDVEKKWEHLKPQIIDPIEYHTTPDYLS